MVLHPLVIQRQSNGSCSAGFMTDAKMEKIVSVKEDSHNHEDKENEIQRQIIRATLKRKATENLGEKPLNLLRRELKDAETEHPGIPQLARLGTNPHPACGAEKNQVSPTRAREGLYLLVVPRL
ncbi:unnamed protein product [Bemisia tabaci]|uniref:Uncharacterized protein n=1 Tax=Bemisia tabaci TaxID=7038 RepID=A0A9P0EWF6_BEMTA|nr:unnamed protein product [Bemisia tabaci]